MPRGGKRTGAGRKAGAKDAVPRHTKSKMVTEQTNKGEIVDYSDSNKPLYLNLEKYISAKNRKICQDLLPKYGSVLDSLKAMRDDSMLRYNFGRVAELEGLKAAKEIAKRKLDEIKDHNTLEGKGFKDDYEKNATIQKLELDIEAKYPKTSTQLTSLATEIRQMNELIDRIESGRSDLKINIFNILGGKGDQKQTVELRNEIFDLPPAAMDAEDAELIKEEVKKNGKKKS